LFGIVTEYVIQLYMVLDIHCVYN